MSDTSYRFYIGDVNKEDLIEIARRPRTSGFKIVLRWILAAFFCFGMFVVVIRGVQPELTPEQIVRLETYQGAQEARRIFNLNSVKMNSALPEVVPVRRDVAGSTDVAREKESAVLAGVLVERHLPEIEVPAVAVSIELPLSTTRVVSSKVVSEFIPERPGSRKLSEFGVVEPRMLPIYSVVVESVELREAPSLVSRVVKSVSRADTVTLFTSDGKWVEVAVNDGSGVTGYVPRSAIVALEP